MLQRDTISECFLFSLVNKLKMLTLSEKGNDHRSLAIYPAELNGCLVYSIFLVM